LAGLANEEVTKNKASTIIEMPLSNCDCNFIKLKSPDLALNRDKKQSPYLE
jgi:hypothetical protein